MKPGSNDDARAGLFSLAGRTALVTGGTKGIGKAIALRMAQAGAKVVVASRNAARCQSTAEEIVAAGGIAHGIACDVGDLARLPGLVEAAQDAAGPIDILVGNAAVNPHYGPLTEIDEDKIDRIFATNVKSNLWLARQVLADMATRGRGSVIFMSSLSAIRGSDDIGAYGASKAALMAMTRHLAVRWGPHGINVNAIAPGVIRTDFAKALWTDPDKEARIASAYPMRRIGEPDDIAGVAVFLASRAGAFVTGQTLVVDGGGSIAGVRAPNQSPLD